MGSSKRISRFTLRLSTRIVWYSWSLPRCGRWREVIPRVKSAFEIACYGEIEDSRNHGFSLIRSPSAAHSRLSRLGEPFVLRQLTLADFRSRSPAEMLKARITFKMTGVNLTHVSYRGSVCGIDRHA